MLDCCLTGRVPVFRHALGPVELQVSLHVLPAGQQLQEGDRRLGRLPGLPTCTTLVTQHNTTGGLLW